MSLKATALSVKPGGKVGSITIGGRVRTAGDDVVTVEIEGDVDRITVGEGISAEGNGSDAVHVQDHGPNLTGIPITATHGQALLVRSEQLSPLPSASALSMWTGS